MGPRPLAYGSVAPLTILDDHSRYGLNLTASADKREATVQARLTACFQLYGIPRAILTDNGPPWGSSGGDGLTALEVWLIRLGIAVRHGRPYHPQTQGKVERWHRTIAADVFSFRPPFRTHADLQAAFDAFRPTYNLERPHYALDFTVPADHYHPSTRPFPRVVPELEVADGDAVRLVRAQGAISFQNRSIFIGRGLIGEQVALRPTLTDGCFDLRFGHHLLRVIDLRAEIT